MASSKDILSEPETHYWKMNYLIKSHQCILQGVNSLLLVCIKQYVSFLRETLPNVSAVFSQTVFSWNRTSSMAMSLKASLPTTPSKVTCKNKRRYKLNRLIFPTIFTFLILLCFAQYSRNTLDSRRNLQAASRAFVAAQEAGGRTKLQCDVYNLIQSEPR